MNESLSEKGCGGSTVTRRIVGFCSNLANKLCAHILCGTVKLDLLCDGNTVVGDKRSAELFLENYITTLRAKSDFNGIGKLINAVEKCGASLHSVKNFL